MAGNGPHHRVEILNSLVLQHLQPVTSDHRESKNVFPCALHDLEVSKMT